MVANLSVAGVVNFFEDLGVLIGMSGHNKRHLASFDKALVEQALSGPKFQQALSEAIREVDGVLKRTESLLTLMPSPHVEAAVEKLRYWSQSKDKDWSELFSRACLLRDTVQTELKQYVFYAYPLDKGRTVMAFEADWDAVLHAFPTARSDAYSACDCWALRHPTASVFHSMRVAELGLRALARERKLSLPKNKAVEWGTWQEIITALDAEIKRIGLQMRAGRPKDAALAFYSGARADLNGFKDEFRNAVMHVRSEYDELQAQRALTQVQAFMERLAQRISEQSQRINWTKVV